MSLESTRPLKAFISYKWEDVAHNQWVEKFAADLRKAGIESILDRWEVRFGDSFTDYMTSKIRQADVVLFIMTTQSVAAVEAPRGEGGAVKFELQMATARRTAGENMRLIGIYRQGEKTAAHLRDHRYADFRDDSQYESRFKELTDDLLGITRAPSVRSPARTPTAHQDDDLVTLQSLLERKEWKRANEETRTILLYLAGPNASRRGHIKSCPVDEAARIPCNKLQAIKDLWYRVPEGVAVQEKYPRVIIARKSEVERPLFDEMRVVEKRCQDCEIEPFIWYMRPDGEILSGPESWLQESLLKLSQTSKAASELLTFITMLHSTEHMSSQIFLKGAAEVGPAFLNTLNSAPDEQKALHDILNLLAKLSLIYRWEDIMFFSYAPTIYGLGDDHYADHQFIRKRIRAEMDEETKKDLTQRIIRAMSKTFPHPNESESWPPDETLARLTMTYASRAWGEEGWETQDGASLLNKLGHYSRTVDKDEVRAEEYFNRASLDVS
jgi:hypothetical protein